MKKFRTIALAAIVALTFGTIAFAADIEITEKAAKPVAKVKLIDINTATENQLKAIPGLDDKLARKIISGRPYAKTEQLKAKNIIPADSYEKIKKLIDAVC